LPSDRCPAPTRSARPVADVVEVVVLAAGPHALLRLSSRAGTAAASGSNLTLGTSQERIYQGDLPGDYIDERATTELIGCLRVTSPRR
jgi:hypothetical protein